MKHNFCGFKTGYLLEEDYPAVTGTIEDPCTWNKLTRLDLPKGWDFRGTDISGAAGFVIVFDIDELPTESDLDYVVASLQQLEQELLQEQQDKKEGGVDE